MRITRVLGVVAGLAAIGLILVHLRAEQVRAAARIADAEAEWTDLRRELWAVQARAARLRAPQRLHSRLDNLSAQLVQPAETTPTGPAAKLATRGP